MRKDDILEALGEIDEKHLLEVEKLRDKKINKPIFVKPKFLIPVGLAASLGIFLAGSFLFGADQGGNMNITERLKNDLKPFVLAQADYPSLSKQPNYEDYGDGVKFDDKKYDADFNKWMKDQEQIEVHDLTIYDGYNKFLKNANQVMLDQAEDSNLVYSPLNIYMATSMLSELAEGNTKTQILDLLGQDDMDKIRDAANNIWKDNYQDDGRYTSIMANSMWTQEGKEYNEETLANLTKNYYAGLYEGQFGTKAYDQAIQKWIDENTNNLLEDSSKTLEFKDNTVMALISTIYFKDSWSDAFEKNNNTQDVFKSPKGDQNVTFMNSTVKTSAYEGKEFIAADLAYRNSGSMLFIKPKDGFDLKDLIKSDDLASLLEKGYEYHTTKKMDVNFKVPKFDLSDNLDMIESMKKMGLTDVFDPAKSDLSNLFDTENNLAVDQFLHSTRIKIDEEGTEAASYTVIAVSETSAFIDELEELDMNLDEPFLFAIKNRSGAVTFMGMVNSID